MARQARTRPSKRVDDLVQARFWVPLDDALFRFQLAGWLDVNPHREQMHRLRNADLKRQRAHRERELARYRANRDELNAVRRERYHEAKAEREGRVELSEMLERLRDAMREAAP